MAALLHHLGPHLDPCDVELVLLDTEPVEQNLPEWLRLEVLNGQKKLVQSYRELRRYWRARGAPTVCVSYLTRSNCLNVWLQREFGHKAVISERVHSSSHFANSKAGVISAQLVRWSYRHAKRVIAVSGGVKADLVANFRVPAGLVDVIGNPVDGAALRARAEGAPDIDLPERFILAMGRLVKSKNFGHFLAGYARSDAPDLVLLGQGPLEADLRAAAAALGIADRVHLPGFVTNPYPVLARAEALVSTSLAEGFPNTVIEAMCLGVPIVATDTMAGAAQVLDGPEGPAILVPEGDVGALGAAITRMMQPDVRADHAARSARAAQQFGVQSVIDDYLIIIHDQLGQNPQEV